MNDLIERMTARIDLIRDTGRTIDIAGQMVTLDKDFIIDRLQKIGQSTEKVETVDGVTYVLLDGDLVYLIALGYMVANSVQTLQEINDEVENDDDDDESDGSGGGLGLSAIGA